MSFNQVPFDACGKVLQPPFWTELEVIDIHIINRKRGSRPVSG
jgi:hypothetical protein